MLIFMLNMRFLPYHIQIDDDDDSRIEQLIGNFVLRRKGKKTMFFFMSIKTNTKNRGIRNVVSFPQSNTFFIMLHTFFSFTHTVFSTVHR